MAKHHRAQHDFFGQAVSFGFHHQHRPLGAGDHQIQLRGFQVIAGRIQQILAVVIADPRRADRAVKRHARQRHRRRSADHGDDFRVHLTIQRHHRSDDLHLISEAIGEQRAQRAINQPGGEGFALGRAAFAPEETAGNPACGVSSFLIIHPQRQKIPTFLGFSGGDYSDQHHGIGHVDQHRAAGLPGNLASLQRHGMRTVLKCLFDGRHESVLCGKKAMENLSGAGQGDR